MGVTRLVCYASAFAVTHLAAAQSPPLNPAQVRSARMSEGEIEAYLKRSGRDALSPTTIISSLPLACQKGSSCAFFRSTLKKDTLEVAYEMYFASLTLDQPIRAKSATFLVRGTRKEMAAQSLDTRIDCSLGRKCQALEQVSVSISKDDFESIAQDSSSQYLQARLFGARGVAPDFWLARREAGAVLRAMDVEIKNLGPTTPK